MSNATVCEHEFIRAQTTGDPPGPLGPSICVKCGQPEIDETPQKTGKASK